MAAAGAKFRQEMPPPGGYEKFVYERVPARTIFGGKAIIGGYLVMTAGAAYLYALNYKAVKNRELEMRCASLAIYPMLLAERDREYLKQLRRNRDEETKLMANVEGWKTGTWYGEPIFHTNKPDTLVNPRFQDYYVHASFKDFKKRGHIGLLS
ncbi:NADH dehydrogenase (ubiquinone) B16.6 subunit [Leptinotarsa decemlineata]|uniref:NADH dehydrogenase (ubiquinone) B16.6 subunit n=1 Tax=Leptinotarsa decemlineata TaxID=7539 RepID=UPI000C252041|nr:NADH dehydrogenase [ubiquinone] 1 alpha subcomplex subunit 13 [Leptinotarsa decemlineata]